MNAVEQLSRLVAPPSDVPFPAGNELHPKFATTIKLPDDYVQFLATYGEGALCGGHEFYIFDLVSDPSAAFENKNHRCAATFCSLPMFETYNINDNEIKPYPAIPGVLPWGCDDQGNTFFWVVDGPPNSWITAVGRIYNSLYCKTMSQLLLQCVCDRIPFYSESTFDKPVLYYSVRPNTNQHAG